MLFDWLLNEKVLLLENKLLLLLLLFEKIFEVLLLLLLKSELFWFWNSPAPAFKLLLLFKNPPVFSENKLLFF